MAFVTQLGLAWLIVEALFFICQIWRYRMVNTNVPVPVDLPRVEMLMQRFLSLAPVMALEEFASGWFHNAPFSALKRGNMEALFSWIFFFRSYDDLTLEWQRLLKKFVNKVELAWHTMFQPGTNPHISHMAPTAEPLRIIPKPLALYLLSALVGRCTHFYLKRVGFARHTYLGLQYWVRLPRRPREGAAGSSLLEGTAAAGLAPEEQASLARHLPVIFLHGLGVGLAPYVKMILALIRTYRRHPIILVEFPHVSLRLCWTPPSYTQLADSLAALLRAEGYARATLVAHSWGSLVASRFAQLHPDKVAGLVLMEAVCLGLVHPRLQRTFFYDPLLLDRHSLAEAVMRMGRLFLFRDLSIAHYCTRLFVWHELMLWPEDMPDNTLILLSGADDLLPIEMVQAQVKRSGKPIVVLHRESAPHGHIVVDRTWQLEFISNVWPVMLQNDNPAEAGDSKLMSRCKTLVQGTGLAPLARRVSRRWSKTLKI